MSQNAFTDPDESDGEWVDVRMTDPDEGEWDVDAVVVGGRVEYVDLHVRPDVVAGFVDCLLDDVGDDRAAEILRDVAERQGVDLEKPEGRE